MVFALNAVQITGIIMLIEVMNDKIPSMLYLSRLADIVDAPILNSRWHQGLELHVQCHGQLYHDYQ